MSAKETEDGERGVPVHRKGDTKPGVKSVERSGVWWGHLVGSFLNAVVCGSVFLTAPDWR